MIAPVSFGADTLTVLTPAPMDWNGDPTGEAAETEVPGCYVQPLPGITSNELRSQRDTVTTSLIAYVPAGAQIPATAQVRWGGRLYEVDGEPAAWSTPGGQQHHLEVRLKIVTG